MIWASLIIFTIIALYAEYAIWRNYIKENRSIWREVYLWSTLLIWGIFIVLFIISLTLNRPNFSFLRTLSVATSILCVNNSIKIIYAILSWGGRKTGAKRTWNIIALFSIGILLAIGVYSCTKGMYTIRTETLEITSGKVPESFDGFRIAVFSDVHIGSSLKRYKMLGDMTDVINSMNPDIVINCGDIVNNNYTELDEQALNILGNISPNYGVYSVIGNHDLGIYSRNPDITTAQNTDMVTRLLTGLGWHVLRDESENIISGTDTITITGIEYPAEMIGKSHKRVKEEIGISSVYDGMSSDRFNITISHAPQLWNEIRGQGKGDLTVSGHVHSMQFKAGIKKKWSVARLFYDQWSGEYVCGHSTLYVNDGIGHALVPFRIGCKPEVTLLILRRDESNYIDSDFE